MTEFNRTFNEWFNLVNTYQDGIKVCEKRAAEMIDQYMLDFFDDRGIKFELFDNKWDTINRYHLQDLPYPKFKPNHAPAYHINPFSLIITFRWWKKKNNKETKILWDPREETLEDLYDQKLKKVFKLI